MEREHHLIPSESLGRPVHVWRYGHYGPPLLVFPSASGMAHEWDAHGVIDALAGWLDAGKLKVYATESNVGEAWTRREGDPAWRIGRHRAFEHYVVHELVPFVRWDCRTEDIRLAVSGTSLGAYYAANFALKRPELFSLALCLSGRYDITEFAGGLQSLELYFNNPMAYVPNLDGEALERVRRGTRLVLVCGRGKWEEGNVEETARFAGILADKGIPHELDLWGTDVSHEWPWWRRQIVHHLGRVLPD